MINKIRSIVLLLGIIISAASGFSNNSLTTRKDGTGTIVINKSNNNGFDRSSSIIATINGHVLSVVFTENLGQVAIAVTYADGGTVDTSTIQTPSGVNIYIAGTGSFVVRFTLRNGDEYWGEFEISE